MNRTGERYGAPVPRLLVPLIALGGLLGINGGAQSSSPAERGARYCEIPATVPASARQVVVVDAFGASYAIVSLRVRGAGGFECSRDGMLARVGRNGIRPLDERVSGDGTTPAG